MSNEQAINTAIGCVMSSGLHIQDKTEVIKKLRELELMAKEAEDEE